MLGGRVPWGTLGDPSIRKILGSEILLPPDFGDAQISLSEVKSNRCLFGDSPVFVGTSTVFFGSTGFEKLKKVTICLFYDEINGPTFFSTYRY